MRELITVLSLACTICAIAAKYIVRPYIRNDKEKIKIILERFSYLHDDVDSLRRELKSLRQSVLQLNSSICSKTERNYSYSSDYSKVQGGFYDSI